MDINLRINAKANMVNKAKAYRQTFSNTLPFIGWTISIDGQLREEQLRFFQLRRGTKQYYN